jgi:hypothetical protein
MLGVKLCCLNFPCTPQYLVEFEFASVHLYLHILNLLVMSNVLKPVFILDFKLRSLTLYICSCAPFACINRRTWHLDVDIRYISILSNLTLFSVQSLLTYTCLQTCCECGENLERCPLCQQHITIRIKLY